MSRFILAVDGGGTKTDCVLVTDSGRAAGYVQWGPTSHEFLADGMGGVSREVSAMLTELFSRTGTGPEDILTSVWGMAGVDSTYQQELLDALIGTTGIRHHLVCNDGYLGIMGATSAGYGGAIINGTGCSITGIGKDGRRLQIGGQSIVMDDVAGGNVIGRHVVKLVFEDLVLGTAKTALSAMLLDRMQLAPGDFPEKLVGAAAAGAFAVKELAPLMFEAAAAGDRAARTYLQQTGREIGERLNALIADLDLLASGNAEIILIGSAFLQAADPAQIEAMKDTVRKRFGEGCIVWKPLPVRPVCGAAVWALSLAGTDIPFGEDRTRYLKTLNGELTDMKEGNSGTV